MQRQSPPPISTSKPSQSVGSGYFGKPTSRIGAEHDVLWHGISCCSALVRCPSCAPPNVFLTPVYLLEGQGEKQNALILCKHCSAIAETLVCYQHWFGHKSKTWHYRGCCEEKLSPCQLDTVTQPNPKCK